MPSPASTTQTLSSEILGEYSNSPKPRSASLTTLESKAIGEGEVPFFYKTPPAFNFPPITKPLKPSDFKLEVEIFGPDPKGVVMWDTDVGAADLIRLPFTILLSLLDPSAPSTKSPRITVTQMDVALVRPIGLNNQRSVAAPHGAPSDGSHGPRPVFSPMYSELHISICQNTDLRDTYSPPLNPADFLDESDSGFESSWHRHSEVDASGNIVRKRRTWCLRGGVIIPVHIFHRTETRSLAFSPAVCMRNEEADVMEWIMGEQVIPVTVLRTERELSPLEVD